MYKKIINKEDLLKHAKEGISLIESITSRTLGPGGLPILLSREDQVDIHGKPKPPLITKDGVTVASSIKVKNAHQDLIMQAALDVARKTDRLCGDGTTTALLLAKSILFEALDTLEKSPELNPQLVKLSIEDASRKIIEHLDSIAVPLENNYDLLENVANISSNGEERVAKILREAFEKVGSEGTISIDYGNGLETQLQVVEGFEINRGLEGGTRLTNDKNQTKFECDNVHVILYDGNLNDHSEIYRIVNEVIGKHYLEEAIKEGRDRSSVTMPPLLVVANEFSQSVLTSLIIQRVEYQMNVAAVRSPHQTKIRTQMLDDLAVMLAGTRLGNGNKSLKNCTWDDIGIAKRVVAVNGGTTIFYGYEDNEEKIIQRIDQLRAQKQLTRSEYDRHLFEDRAAGLACAVAKIAVGGTTDLEIFELYHRYEDALNACKAAIAEGVVPGGGVTFLRASEILEGETEGEQIIKKALKNPINQLLENIGCTKGEKDQIKSMLEINPDKTYDARNRCLVDPFEAGIVDPVLVLKTALKNAVSIAALLSTAGGGVIFDLDGVKK